MAHTYLQLLFINSITSLMDQPGDTETLQYSAIGNLGVVPNSGSAMSGNLLLATPELRNSQNGSKTKLLPSRSSKTPTQSSKLNETIKNSVIARNRHSSTCAPNPNPRNSSVSRPGNLNFNNNIEFEKLHVLRDQCCEQLL